MLERHHAVIAGTGRAGTSFLVQFLARCGVPTGDLDDLGYDPTARAGYEVSVLDADDRYLIKDPLFAEYLDVVDLDRLTIDALIVPVRELRRAAQSRIKNEYTAHRRAGQPRHLNRVSVHTPGGMVNSVNAIDQERLLAVGFAKLVEWSLRWSVPLYLLQYPRLVDDRDYLIDTLWPWLGRFCDRQTAVEAFDEVCDPSPDRAREPVIVDEVVAAAEMARLEAENETLYAEIERLREHLRESQRALRANEKHVVEFQRMHADMTHRLEHTKAQMEAIKRSRTYRFAAGLRQPVGLFRRVFASRS